MIYQTDSKIEAIRKWGCYFTVLSAPAEKYSGKNIDMAIVEKAYHIALDRGLILSDCYVNDPERVILLFAELVSVKLKVKMLYKFKNGDKTIYNKSDKFPNFYAAYFIKDNPQGHFCETDKFGNIIYNPYPMDMTKWHIHSSRCFLIEKE